MVIDFVSVWHPSLHAGAHTKNKMLLCFGNINNIVMMK